MLIYIPTKGRTHKPQLTYTSLPVHWQKKTWFVTTSDEAKSLQRQYDTNRVLVCDLPGVPAARQAVLEHGMERYVFMFDDDLRFCRRVEDWTPEKPSMRKSTEKDIDEALHLMQDKLETRFVQVGFGYRGNNNAIPEKEFRIACRMMRSFGVDVDYLNKLQIRFDKYLFWEDFHVTLSLLTRGFPNWMSVVHCTDGVTNSEGGVSLYRTPERLLSVREEFLKEHAPFAVANDDKSAKGWAGTDSDVMPDLKIYWQKAYKYGLKRLKETES